jgi:hypothetical protein
MGRRRAKFRAKQIARKGESSYLWRCKSCREKMIRKLTESGCSFRVRGCLIYTADERACSMMNPYIDEEWLGEHGLELIPLNMNMIGGQDESATGLGHTTDQ